MARGRSSEDITTLEMALVGFQIEKQTDREQDPGNSGPAERQAESAPSAPAENDEAPCKTGIERCRA